MWLNFRRLQRLYSNISHSNLKVTYTNTPKPKPNLETPLAFGTASTDHILVIDWNSTSGWEQPQIVPYGPFQLDPCASVLHYATEVFEGMKAYKTEDGKFLLFRPEKNMHRMRSSVASVGLPDFDGDEFLKCLKELIKVDKDWIPSKKGYSLYVRPTMIATDPKLGVVKPSNAKLFVVLTAVGPYFPQGFKPVKLYCDENVVRAWPGGVGDRKIGGNYAPGISITEKVNKLGYSQMLWLVNNYVTEVGTMNFFVFWKNEAGEEELITAPLDSTILPGVTRDSILSLARDWNEFKVSERKFTIDEFVKASEEGRIIEAFGAGTACVVCPVETIHFNGKDHQIPLKLGESGELAKRFLEEIQGIQYGKKDHPWAHQIL